VEGEATYPGKSFSNYCKTPACLTTFVNNCYTAFHENPINSSVADIRSQTDRCDLHIQLFFTYQGMPERDRKQYRAPPLSPPLSLSDTKIFQHSVAANS